MLAVSYKIKGLLFNEQWFSSKVPLTLFDKYRLSCYRSSVEAIKPSGFKQEVKQTLLNELTLTEEELFSAFKSNLRNEIRKCEKLEDFEYQSSSLDKKVFLEFYSRFANAKSLTPISAHSIDKYKDNLLYFSAQLEGKLTNMQVYLLDKEGGTVRLLHSISTLYEEESKTTKAKIGWINRYLHWKAMLHFKSLDFKSFDWGGYTDDKSSPLAGIDKFKASFGGKKVQRYDYYSQPYALMKLIQEKIL